MVAGLQSIAVLQLKIRFVDLVVACCASVACVCVLALRSIGLGTFISATPVTPVTRSWGRFLSALLAKKRVGWRICFVSAEKLSVNLASSDALII